MAAKFLSTPMQCSDTYLEDVEQQASLLFEEFLRLPDPVSSRRLCASVGEVADGAPSVRMDRAYEQEECLTDDEHVTDSAGLVSKSLQPAPNGERPVAQNAHDQTLKDLALKMRDAGDKLVNDYGYGDRASGIESTLVKVITNSTTNLTYEKFSNEVDKLIGQERNWTNLVLAYYVGQRVISKVGEVQGYFTRYVSQSFRPVYQEAGGVEQLVKSKMAQ